jgi:hypothetical protein
MNTGGKAPFIIYWLAAARGKLTLKTRAKGKLRGALFMIADYVAN